MIRFIKEIEVNEGNLSGWINIFLDTVTDTYLVSADFNEVKDEIYKEGFKTIEAAQVWAEEQVEEHLEDW
jgi:hypothetical protein